MRPERQLRIGTRRGGIRVFYPRAAVPPAFVVLYVHGYGSSVDSTWRGHGLLRQFRASGRNAVYISVEAPDGPDDYVRFPRLDRVLQLVERRTRSRLPRRLVAMGHSGAYRTLIRWLRHPRLRHVILLDSLYTSGRYFAAWFRKNRRNRLTVVFRGRTPTRNSRRLARTLGKAALLRRGIPSMSKGFPARLRTARALFLRAQYTHLAIVTSRRAIPVLLRDRLQKNGPRASRRPPGKARARSPRSLLVGRRAGTAASNAAWRVDRGPSQ